MATCKRATGMHMGSRCNANATEAVIFSTWLDDGYIIQTQMPLCAEHLPEKVNELTLRQIPHFTVTLGLSGMTVGNLQ